ncbi:hypothetical protein A7P89_02225 [Eikenella corrodens]|uniref:Uncharacterized protein n=1 Tax=Eikenella corrodens TaxID=539 RepID=A0A1A9RSZ1_EIKCO|nr:hypothetical protein A7P89_02225 [Eikenella corrodens]
MPYPHHPRRQPGRQNRNHPLRFTHYSSFSSKVWRDCIIWRGVAPSLSFQDAEYHYLACRTATTSAFAVPIKVAFIQFDNTVKDFISNQCQMMADDHTDFSVEQDSGVELYA